MKTFFLGAAFSLLTMAASPVVHAAHKMNAFRLDNGLQLVVIEDRRSPAISQTLWYRVGAADEPPGKSGIAHYVEHLMFKGTRNFAPGFYRQTVQNLGGNDNAFTSRDSTGYIQRIAADHLETIMELEADRMHNLILTDEDIETERRVVLEERNMRTDTNPGALLSEQMSASLYLNHPYSIPIIGWRNEIEQLSRDDIFNFYKTHYAPNNAVLVIAGDIAPHEALRLAQEHYGPLPANPHIKTRIRPQEPPHLAERRLVMTDERIATPYIVRRYLAPERNPGEQRTAASLSLLAAILGGDGINSFLTQKLEIEADISIYSSAYYRGTSVDPTGFGLVVVPADSVTMKEAEEALDEAIDKFLQIGVEEAQLNRIKKGIYAANIYEQDSVQNVARRVGEALSSGLTLEDVRAWPDILQSVTAAEILDAARSLFRPESSVTGWALKEDIES